MFGFSLREIFSNVIGSLVADAITPSGMMGWGLAIAFAAWWAVHWHRQQRAAKKPGMASWQFISLCFAIAAVAIAFGAYGLGLKFATPPIPPVTTVEASPVPAPIPAPPTSSPKLKPYSDKADAKEALENLHDILVKKVQPAVAIFPRVDSFSLQRSLEQAVRNRFNMMDRPGQTERPDPKVVRTEAIKNFLNNQLSAITDENTKLGEAIGAIYQIRAKQKAITAGRTEEFFCTCISPASFRRCAGKSSDVTPLLFKTGHAGNRHY